MPKPTTRPKFMITGAKTEDHRLDSRRYEEQQDKDIANGNPGK
jgi:hypothetical protein